MLAVISLGKRLTNKIQRTIFFRSRELQFARLNVPFQDACNLRGQGLCFTTTAGTEVASATGRLGALKLAKPFNAGPLFQATPQEETKESIDYDWQ